MDSSPSCEKLSAIAKVQGACWPHVRSNTSQMTVGATSDPSKSHRPFRPQTKHFRCISNPLQKIPGLRGDRGVCTCIPPQADLTHKAAPGRTRGPTRGAYPVHPRDPPAHPSRGAQPRAQGPSPAQAWPKLGPTQISGNLQIWDLEIWKFGIPKK